MDLAWTDLSDDNREQQYSPSSCLPNGDYEPFVAAYRERSDRVWAELQGRPDVSTFTVRYGSLDQQTIDVVVPLSEAAPPILVFIHGGYWQELSRLDSRFPALDCAEQSWAFAAVDYTLAPAATLDEIVAECRAAIATLHAQAARLGFDPGRIVVAGSSAGAHLAAMVALDDSVEIAGTVLVSGIFELAPLLGTSINDAVGLDIEAADRNSPLQRKIDRFPPTIVAYGSVETAQFKAQSGAFAQHLAAAGTRVEQVEVPGRNHFDVILDLAQRETVLGGAVASLMNARPEEYSDEC